MDIDFFTGVGLPTPVPASMRCTGCARVLRPSVAITGNGEPLAWAYCSGCAISHCPYGRHVVERTLSVPGRTKGRSKNVYVCVTGDCAGLHERTQRLLSLMYPCHGRTAYEWLDRLLQARSHARSTYLSTDWRRIYVEHLARVGGLVVGIDVANADRCGLNGGARTVDELLAAALKQE